MRRITGDIEAKGDWNDENDFNLSFGYYHVTTPGKDSFRKVQKSLASFSSNNVQMESINSARTALAPPSAFMKVKSLYK